MGKLIIISNRVPLPDKHGSAPAGGLVVALQAALEEMGGLWMAGVSPAHSSIFW